MTHRFGHGFITSIVLIAEHFALPPENAWMGAGDHVEGLVLPDRFKGTEIEELTTLLRKKVIWHSPGSMDREDAREVGIPRAAWTGKMPGRSSSPSTASWLRSTANWELQMPAWASSSEAGGICPVLAGMILIFMAGPWGLMPKNPQ
jgi:hypothetical protein